VGSLGTPEIILILVLALLLFGPQKLPELGKSFARAIKEFKRASAELQETIEREVEDLKKDADLLGDRTPSFPRSTLPPPPPRMPEPVPPEPSGGTEEGKDGAS